MITEKDLIQTVKTALSCTEAAAKEAVRALFRTIADEVALNPEGVRLPELGTLRRVAREAKPGHNPRTGEKLTIPARYAVTFTAGSHLKSRLAELAPPVFRTRRQAAE